MWTYDNAGNRTSEKTYALTTGTLGAVTSTKNYSYSNSAWGDLLTFDGRNYITYDEIGNPTRIYQDDGGFYYGYELTWEGRRLTAYTYFEEEGSYEYYDTPTTYTYNADGIRTSKTTDVGIKYEYLLDGSRIVSQTWDDNIFVFIYDENGSPIGINYTTAEHSALDTFQSYYFEKNLQGDIIAIYNSSGTKIGTYTYDAWGNVTTNYHTSNSTDSFVVSSNPFRYRGYYYDSDTQLYYLQTRYYNPANGRFLNGDSALYNSILGFNLYAYCVNNPIMLVDPTGEWFVIDDVFTGPIDEIIIIGGLAILGLCGLPGATEALEATKEALEDACDGITALFDGDDASDTDEDNTSDTDGETIPEPTPNPDDAPPSNLPHQGEVSEIPDAPPVDAGSQGKHVPGHNNNDPKRSQWKVGENGVKQTQEAWKNGKIDPKGRPYGSVRIGQSSDGRIIRVHINGSGHIHGYPIFP